jgi:hypothetical protein
VQSPPDAPPLPWRVSRDVDVTGDGRPERIVVSADGPTAEALTVTLAITSPGGERLYRTRWPAAAYFKYAYPDDRTEQGLRRAVRAHIERLTADSALAPRSVRDTSGRVLAWLDSAVVQDDVHQHPRAGTTEPRRVASLLRELRGALPGRPTFTYFGGGEETYTLVWSTSEHRFVRIFACC